VYHLVQPETIPVCVEAGGATAAQEDALALEELAFEEEAALLVDDFADEVVW